MLQSIANLEPVQQVAARLRCTWRGMYKNRDNTFIPLRHTTPHSTPCAPFSGPLLEPWSDLCGLQGPQRPALTPPPPLPSSTPTTLPPTTVRPMNSGLRSVSSSASPPDAAAAVAPDVLPSLRQERLRRRWYAGGCRRSGSDFPAAVAAVAAAGAAAAALPSSSNCACAFVEFSMQSVESRRRCGCW